MIAVLITSLMLSGCAASEKNKDKKADEKVSHKEQDKSKSKKKEAEKKAKEVKETTEEASQEQETQASLVQETPVATGISSMFTDDELFAFADETVNTFYAERMSYICGTHFTSSSTGSFTENSTVTKSGFFDKTSRCNLCMPITEPVAPIPAFM